MPGEEDSVFTGRIAAYLQAKWPEATAVSVSDLKRFHGGASRETYRFTAHVRGERGGSGERTQGIILRRDPKASLIETERRVEFSAYRSFHGTKVPVPEPLFLEEDPKWLDRPFFMMQELPGLKVGTMMESDPYGAQREKVADQFWGILGAIAATPVEETELARVVELPAREDCWKRELGSWESEVDTDELRPWPIIRAAIRHLRRNPPPTPARLSVVHGDYRSGNFLFDDTGTIRGILDWEMAHVGDPLEDLAWASDEMWAHGDPGTPAGMVPAEAALAIWTRASGLEVDPRAFDWWRIFAAVKAMAIWISSAKEFIQGSNVDPILAFAGWLPARRHDRILLKLLGHG